MNDEKKLSDDDLKDIAGGAGKGVPSKKDPSKPDDVTRDGSIDGGGKGPKSAFDSGSKGK